MGLAMTTLGDVKLLLGRDPLVANAIDDAVIADLILAVSQANEEYLGRWSQSSARVETYPVNPNQAYVSLRGFPATAVTSVKYASKRDFTGIDDMDTARYALIPALGQIQFHSCAGLIYYDPGYVQVSYTGGMAADATAFKTAFPRIANATAADVVNRFNRRSNPDGNVTVLGNSVAYRDQMEPLADLKVALDAHRRYRLR